MNLHACQPIIRDNSGNRKAFSGLNKAFFHQTVGEAKVQHDDEAGLLGL